jgi:uncharacterized protein with HEPN domain
MVSTRDISIIVHINNYCDQIIEGMIWYGNSIEALKMNHIYKDGMAMKLQQISELAQRLTADFTREHGNMPWRLIKGLRVIFARQYLTLDYQTLLETMSVKIPELKIFCTEILTMVERQSHNDGSGPGGPRMA